MLDLLPIFNMVVLVVWFGSWLNNKYTTNLFSFMYPDFRVYYFSIVVTINCINFIGVIYE